MDQIEASKAASALFLLDKGVQSDFHGQNYLFSRFYNPKVTNDTPVFYLYQQQFSEIIVSTFKLWHMDNFNFLV